MVSPQQFIDAQIGKTVDVDGYYGPQCWDLFAFFCQEAGYPVFNCTTTGFVKDIYNDRYESGILNYFDDVSVMQKGDWCVWGNSPATPFSHIAMFVQDNGNGTGLFFGQNQGSPVANVTSIPYAGSLGALRPHCYIDTPVVKNRIGYQVHMKDIGWGSMVYDGEMAGTTGEGRRVEAVRIDPFSYIISAKAHLQDIGWVTYGIINKDTIIGTVGESRRLEALCLTGNVIYRAHIAEEGWSAWTQADGIATVGTVGMSHAIEAIEIKPL